MYNINDNSRRRAGIGRNDRKKQRTKTIERGMIKTVKKWARLVGFGKYFWVATVIELVAREGNERHRVIRHYSNLHEIESISVVSTISQSAISAISPNS